MNLFKFKFDKQRLIGVIVAFVGGLLLIGLDQLTKAQAENEADILLNTFNLPILNKLFTYSLTYNKGAYGGMLSGSKFMLVSISLLGTLISLFLIARFADFKNQPLFTTCLMLLFGGTTGNLIDRAFFENGVIDFIQFAFWPSFNTFNLADAYLTVACVLLVIYVVFFEGRNKEENKEDSKDEGEEANA